jgi:hypothetical protein
MLGRANTLAYYAGALVTTSKGFTTSAAGLRGVRQRRPEGVEERAKRCQDQVLLNFCLRQ